ncbi:MAG: DUF2780 domain-containing protein [Methylobacter sp.]|nr:DUF2780 domain-containing protein [Methylococcales bacterium]MDD5112879.1 DUF2780 domain-containing protein [Methylobacter sp.]
MNNKPILLAGSIALITTISCNANAKDWKDILNAVKEQANEQSLKSAVQLQANPQVKNAAEELKPGSLTDLLMQRVGVTQTQAEGGAGALFQVAKGKMQADSFSQLEQSIPGIPSMLGAASTATQTSSLGGLAGGLSSLTGNSGGTTGNLLAVASAFQQQGMSPAMIQQFVPIMIEYVKSNSNDALANTLSSALLGQ